MANKTITPTKHLLAKLSIKVRTDQYKDFESITKPTVRTKILDLGVTSDETLKDSNIFERLYRWPSRLTVATIEDAKKPNKLYPKVKIVKIISGKKLPFNNNAFDVVVSWATLEHVGGYKSQQDFINELLRIGKKVFITTPYRGALYEPHTGFFLLHWLPLKLFRQICKHTNNKFWSTEKNLNPLWISDLKKMKFRRNLNIKVYKTFNLLPSHIIISTK
jgi:hypothetical protein